MHLKKIKLAGFKSFVDPTTVLLPTSLVAIVGPNGCGKSNIIDAVCWVMGESSAKYLRGESLTDVIFNGSNVRKPVGQASVELIFDNQDGTLGGEYASFAEISIRRQISRDAESIYFLNGARCRRRDIIDIFLGTGLGPRSYSIIGQNMISRVIEAKPDEMRVYLEEAAGVSRYKERRRETETRIHHTKENLARLNDVRNELDKQLATLKRQANAAEKFKTLKQEERIVKAEWLTIQWRDLDNEQVNYTLQIQFQVTALEARQADLSTLNLQIDYKRNEINLANENVQVVQQSFYALGNTITRLEQEIAHRQEKEKQKQEAIHETKTQIQALSAQIEEIIPNLQELNEEAALLKPQVQDATIQALAYKDQLTAAEEAMQTWQTQWDAYNAKVSKSTQISQVEQTRIQHLEQKITSLRARDTYLEREKAHIDFSHEEEMISALRIEASKAEENTYTEEQNLEELRDTLSALRITQTKTNDELYHARNALQMARGKESSLQALQETALGRGNMPQAAWVKEYNLDKQPRLAEQLKVEAGWEYAVEKILGACLQAVCVDTIEPILALTDKITVFNQANIHIIAKDNKEAPCIAPALDYPTLASKIHSSWPLMHLLAGIYTAATMDQAVNILSKLGPYESVITPEGVWLGSHWMRLFRLENTEDGIFQREQELSLLAVKIEELVQVCEQLETHIQGYNEKIKSLEDERDLVQASVNTAYKQKAAVDAKEKIASEKLKEFKDRLHRFEQEQDEIHGQLQQAEDELKQANHKRQKALQDLNAHASEGEILTTERDALRNRLQDIRHKASQAKDNAHALEIRLQTTHSQEASLQQSLRALEEQLQALNTRQMKLEHTSLPSQDLSTLELDLNVALNKRLALEEDLQAAKVALQNINQALQLLEKEKHTLEAEVSHIRDQLENLRIKNQGLKVKSETLQEQIKALHVTLEEILTQIAQDANAADWQVRLEQITQRITRLGAINLVAIEEYATCLERKEYLDKQYDDLQEGLTTLENAIEKIDRETRARFKETFDKVNKNFSDLFPKVFGGGHANLELTQDNLLHAGVSVMACPPGKRNSTIHLLSGGEKALTAIALIFSIFQLNPAPFCLLDEVDAPLDDANIGRFCQLVKNMAMNIQFIFISHNKLAIEMGETLVGVTMHEPGVSRLVSVDIQEAISLAEA